MPRNNNNNTPVCADCLQEGHKRSTNRLCLLNRRRLDTLPNNHERDVYRAQVRQHSLLNLYPVRGEQEHQRPIRALPPVIDLPPPPPPPPHVPLARRPFTQDLVKGLDIVEGRHKINRMIACPYCKARVWTQERTGDSKRRPLFSICCMKGRVSIPEIAHEPRLLEFIGEQSRMGDAFRKCIRKYNAALSFTSMGVKVDERLADGREGVYTFRIQGAVVHELGALRAREGQPPKFAQIYFHDPEEQIVHRRGVFPDLDEGRLRAMQAILEETNQLCREYKTIREREAEQRGQVQELRIVLKAAREPNNGRRQRQYDLPSANEVAVLLPGDETDIAPRDIIIQGRDGRLINVFETHPKCDSMQYSLLMPRGEDGWTFNAHRLIKPEDVPPAYPDQEEGEDEEDEEDEEDNDNNDDENVCGPEEEPAGSQAPVPAAEPAADQDDDELDEALLEWLLEDEEDQEEDHEVQAGLDFDGVDAERPAHRQIPDKYVTARAYYAYRLQVRPISDDDSRCFFWLHGRLCQQYVVDQYAKIEASRLRFVLANQKKLRVDVYRGIMDALALYRAAGETGTFTVLPSSFTGGPRFMNGLYQDAMTIVRHFGKPDLFVTFTCNPQWPEIRAELMPGQVPSDRNDLIVRVFNIKLQALLRDLIKKGSKGVLGKVIAYSYVIEFQKRGLPHAHILLILDEASKIRTVNDIDLVVFAEIPDRETCPLSYETVSKSMVHGPCGVHNPNAPCMATRDVTGEKYCTKNFPRELVAETQLNEQGYPKSRRRAGTTIALRNGTLIDSRWIVPHNLWLSTKYNAHINVEVCASVAAVKYLFKYIYKGHDRTKMAVHPSVARHRPEPNPNDINEVHNYQDSRYVSSCEALWRIFKFPLHGRSPAIIRLPVHLEDHQEIRFNENEPLELAVEQAKDTQLMAWFKLNASDEAAREYIYPDIPHHYTWRGHRWNPRKRASNVVTRMYFVHPKDRERFCLRLLLRVIKGATSFADIRTVPFPTQDGDMPVVFDTFRDAALARGLLEDDKEWTQLLQEAILDQMPNRLRHLFAWIVCFCNPSNPLLLWTQFAPHLYDDFLHRLRGDAQQLEPPNQEMVEQAKNSALSDINLILKEMGSSLAEIDNLLDQYTGEDINHHVDRAERQEPAPVNNSALFNPGQRAAFNRIVETLSEGEAAQRKLFFIDGPGGTGKSFLYNTLIAYVLEQHKEVIAVASSGIASLILHSGRTAHSTFKIPLKVDGNSTCYIPAGSPIAIRVKNAAVIIWDEAPMSSRLIFEAVDRTFQNIMRNDSPFGGKVVVFGGDFRQVTPVVPRGSQTQIENSSLKFSQFWHQVETLKLSRNMRVVDDPENQEFIRFLLRVGEGTEPTISSNGQENLINVPNQHVFHPIPANLPDDEKQFIRTIYPGIEDGPLLPEVMAERALLTCLNVKVDELNATALSMMPGDSQIYPSVDCIPNEESVDAGQYSTEFLNTLSPTGLPPHNLELKVGQPIILIRNMNPSRGLCNGTRLIIRQLGRRFIEAEIMVGVNTGYKVIIPRVPLTNSDDNLAFPIKFRRTQFPIKPAFAMTINKAQGQTLQRVGLYLPQSVFGHGQLYVALSRCARPENLNVLIDNGTIEGRQGVYTRNVVFKRLLEE